MNAGGLYHEMVVRQMEFQAQTGEEVLNVDGANQIAGINLNAEPSRLPAT
jgi:hypothetical protein